MTTDLFRAGPYTYAPRDEQRHHRGGVLRNRRDRRYGAPYLAGPWFLANPILMTGDNLARDQVRGAADSMLPQLDDGRQDSGSPAGDREANNALETTQTSFDVIRAAAPKTFYVIPRCYAGDRIPRLEELPRGCELRNLREVPPRRSAQP